MLRQLSQKGVNIKGATKSSACKNLVFNSNSRGLLTYGCMVSKMIPVCLVTLWSTNLSVLCQP